MDIGVVTTKRAPTEYLANQIVDAFRQTSPNDREALVKKYFPKLAIEAPDDPAAAQRGLRSIISRIGTPANRPPVEWVIAAVGAYWTAPPQVRRKPNDLYGRMIAAMDAAPTVNLEEAAAIMTARYKTMEIAARNAILGTLNLQGSKIHPPRNPIILQRALETLAGDSGLTNEQVMAGVEVLARATPDERKTKAAIVQNQMVQIMHCLYG